jgi:hypothetical protein
MLGMVGLILLLSVALGEAQDARKVYFGLMHAHTSFSDGEGTPDEAYTMAKEAGLDFFAITEHNHNQAMGDDGIFLTDALYRVVYLGPADKYFGPLASRLTGVNQPVIGTQNRFSAPHLTQLACI